MNRGLALALLILAFTVTLIGADTILVSEAIDDIATPLSECEACESAAQKVAAVRYAFEKNRFLLTLSLPAERIDDYEAALCELEAATLTQDSDGFAAAHKETALALTQMKRSALFSLEQIF